MSNEFAHYPDVCAIPVLLLEICFGIIFSKAYIERVKDNNGETSYLAA
jgi:hypothetical protein